MDTEKIKRLLEKYLHGETTLEEENELRNYLSGKELPDELQSYADPFRYYEKLHDSRLWDYPEDEKLFADLSPKEQPAGSQMETPRLITFLNEQPDATRWALRAAAAIIFLLAGFSAGLLLNQSRTADTNLAAVQQEIRELRSALVYGGYQNISASERISAINTTSRLPSREKSLDQEITEILVYTMNSDKNVNVRMAAAEALFKFSDESRIRNALVNALTRQDDPMMQLTLINMMVEMKEKSAVNEMQKLLIAPGIRDIVKERLKVGIAELKT